MNVKILQTIHILIILWFILAPYFIQKNNHVWRFYYIWSVGALVAHWVINNNACILSEMEKIARGKEDSDDTFVQEILKPFFQLHTSDVDILVYYILFFNLLYLY